MPGWPLDFDPATISANLADSSATQRAKGDDVAVRDVLPFAVGGRLAPDEFF